MQLQETPKREEVWSHPIKKIIALATTALLTFAMFSCDNNPTINAWIDENMQKYSKLKIKLGKHNFTVNITKIWNEYYHQTVSKWDDILIDTLTNDKFASKFYVYDYIDSEEEKIEKFKKQLELYWNKILTNIQWTQLGDTTYNTTITEDFTFNLSTFNSSYEKYYVNTYFDWENYTMTINNKENIDETNTSNNIDQVTKYLSEEFEQKTKTYTPEELKYFKEYFDKYIEDTYNYLNSDITGSYTKSYTQKDIEQMP